MTKIIFQFSFLFCVLYCFEKCFAKTPMPYALSPVYLQYLENVESHFLQMLKGKSSQDEVFGKYLMDYEESVENHKNVSSNPTSDEISSNPILSLQMINRFIKHFKNDDFVSAANKIFPLEKGIIPTPTEIEDAMEALLRLQHIYDLDSMQLAEGILNGVQTNARLSGRECYELGRFAQESGYYNLALQWYDSTLQKLKNGLNDESSNRDSMAGLKPNLIMKALRETIEEHNLEHDENIKDGDMYSFSTPIYNTNYSSIAHLSLRRRIPAELTGKFLSESDPKFYEAIEANMLALCHGQSLQSEKDKAKLKCWLDTTRNPYWRINPLKIELLHDDPQIIQLYDIFSDKWIEYLKDLSYTQLERAPQPAEATPRTAAYAWFNDVEIPKAEVSRRVEFITGLNVRGTAAAEALQVAAYAFGGHVEPHFDSRGPDDEEFESKGDRVTTFLVYLNEVEQGGFTAFPLLGFHIKPVRNSAVLWYTNMKNGSIDERTLHAACPVIKGQKWIATKWTHINENILKRPCGLKHFE